MLGHSPSKNWSELSNDMALERFAVVYVKAAAQTSDKETDQPKEFSCRANEVWLEDLRD